MCGVVAYLGKIDSGLLERVCKESSVRGLHNFTTYYPNARIGMAHCRYATSGKVHQPLVKGNTAFCFNGVIDMGTKSEMEKRWKIKMVTDNDGEIIMGKTPQEAAQFIRDTHCSFAGVWIQDRKKLIAMRNPGRPLWKIENGGRVLIASTLDILKRAGADWQHAELLEPYKIYSWTI